MVFIVLIEGLFVIPVIPRVNLSGVPTPVGLPMAVSSKRKYQTERDQPPKTQKAEYAKIYNISTAKFRKRVTPIGLA